MPPEFAYLFETIRRSRVNSGQKGHCGAKGGIQTNFVGLRLMGQQKFDLVWTKHVSALLEQGIHTSWKTLRSQLSTQKSLQCAFRPLMAESLP
jgi:hypothetical protein